MKYLYLLICTLLLFSCERIEYPIYNLTTIEYVPDSLINKQREWIKETIRAASQHMTGGDYEDVDETIWGAYHTSNNLFSLKIIGLRKRISDGISIKILPKDFTTHEKYIYDSLINSR